MKESASKKDKLAPKWLKKPSGIIFIGLVSLVMLVAIGLGGYALAYKNEFYPNTYIGTLNVGGKTQAEAEAALSESVAKINEVAIQVDDKPLVKVSTGDLGVEFKVKESVDLVYATDRQGNIRHQVTSIIKSLTNRHDHAVLVSINQEKAQSGLATTITTVGTEPVDAKIVLNVDGSLVINPAKEGSGVTQEDIINELSKQLAKLSNSLTLASHVTQPKIKEADLTSAHEEVKLMLGKAPLTLTAGDKNSTVTPSTLFTWIDYKSVDGKIKTEINKERVKSFVGDVAKATNREAQNATLKVIDGTVQIDKSSADGLELKIDPSVDAIMTQLANTSASSPLTISLTVDVTKAKVSNDNIASLGIKELIGHGETNFTGSPANRIHNIKTGAKFLSGILIPPGEEFSTVKTLGEVDGSTGYLPELVIKDNRTIPEYGGGLCQVSTTLFRSVLNAGLKVTARRNHSYRVSYYEPPVGLDATIYLPGPDFKFMNDTPGYIFVQAQVQGTKITFDLYGTKDGRTSTISDTIITNVTEPAAPQYAETDTLPKGTTKQIEKAHPGADTEVTYTVMRDGQEVNKQVFKSRYQAWQARYLVGTKE